MDSFPLNRLPAELRLEIWDLAVRTTARQRLVIEQKHEVFPTLNLAAPPLLSVNTESREVALAFYSVRLPVYRRRNTTPYHHHQQSSETSHQEPEWGDSAEDQRGLIFLCPELDVVFSIYPWATLHGPSDIKIMGYEHGQFTFDRSPRSKMTAWQHRATGVGNRVLAQFRRQPDRYGLMGYASGRLGVAEWTVVDEWLLGFGEEEYRKVIKLLRSMRLNSREFVQVFGWE